MDPDANLVEMRRLAADMLRTWNHDQTPNISEYDAARLAELVQALDGWITGGGFLPAAWQKAQR